MHNDVTNFRSNNRLIALINNNRFFKKITHLIGDSQIQFFLFKALISAHLIGSGIVYGHFRLFHLIGLFFLPFFLAKFIKEPKKLLKADVIAMSAVFIWYSLSLLWVEDFVLARNYLFYLLNGYFIVFCYCLFIDNVNQIYQSLKVLFYVSIVNLFVGLVESLTSLRWFVARQSSLNSFFGIDPMYNYYFDNLMIRMTDYKVSYEYMLHQPSGFQWGPNQYGLFLCVLFPYLLLFIKRFWVSAFLAQLTLYLSFMVASRSIYISEVAVLLLVTLYFFFRDKKKALFSLILTLVMVSIPFMPLYKMGVNYERAVKIRGFSGAAKNYLNTAFNFNFKSDSDLINELSPDELKDLDILPEEEKAKFIDNSVSQRKIMIIKAFEKFSNSYVKGVGAGNSAQDVGLLFGTTQIHNFWAEIFFELGGLFGLLVFFGFGYLFFKLIFLLKIAIKTKNIKYEKILASNIFALIAIVPGMLAVGTGVYQSIFWILLSITIVTTRVFAKLLVTS